MGSIGVGGDDTVTLPINNLQEANILPSELTNTISSNDGTLVQNDVDRSLGAPASLLALRGKLSLMRILTT